MIYTPKSIEETEEIAKTMLIELIEKHIILLKGELGSGKTTFVQSVAKALKYKKPVKSPTFTLLNILEIDNNPKIDKIIHIDLYRLEKASLQDLAMIGLDEYINDTRSLIMIEWPERLTFKLKAKQIAFKEENQTHTIEA